MNWSSSNKADGKVKVREQQSVVNRWKEMAGDSSAPSDSLSEATCSTHVPGFLAPGRGVRRLLSLTDAQPEEAR